jgi:hypothetical protein
MSVCRIAWICFTKLKICCFPFFQPTFILLSKFMMLSHMAQHKSILINYHLTKKFICPTFRLLEDYFDILYASISVWVHIKNHVLDA